jgi:hypothetical protein
MTTNDKDTFLNRAQAEADLTSQGRFKRETATRVTGVPTCPKQPANSPWATDPVPATEPLGFSVDAMEPVGTPVEIEKSIQSDNSDRSSSSIASIEQGNDVLSVFSSEDANEK